MGFSCCPEARPLGVTTNRCCPVLSGGSVGHQDERSAESDAGKTVFPPSLSALRSSWCPTLPPDNTGQHRFVVTPKGLASGQQLKPIVCQLRPSERESTCRAGQFPPSVVQQVVWARTPSSCRFHRAGDPLPTQTRSHDARNRRPG